MLSLDGTFLVIFLSFIVFMVAMKVIYFDPILAIKYERETSIQAGQQATEDASQKILSLNQEQEAKLAEARRKSQQMVQEKREQAKTTASEKIAQARQSALVELQNQSQRLNQSRDEVYDALQAERGELVQAIIQKVSDSSPKSVATTTSVT